MPSDLSIPSFKPLSGGKPRKLVIMLHGYGSDGNDLIGLAPVLAPILPDAEFLSPNAPQRCEMGPYGYQWFGLSAFTPAALLAGAREAYPALDALIDGALAARGLADSDLALLGFSQGTMMALHTGLRREKPIAGIIGFSGALVGAHLLSQEARSRPPVLLVHGDADPVVPFAALAEAEAALAAAGIPVKTQPCPGIGHGIDETGLRAAAAFLAENLRNKA